jgi:hypothetical protein
MKPSFFEPATAHGRTPLICAAVNPPAPVSVVRTEMSFLADQV